MAGQIYPPKGTTFTHKSFIDPVYTERKLRMRVTKTTTTTVYYTTADSPTNHGTFKMDRRLWIARYGDEEES